jgi:DNA excision repair protein ERCC-4
MLVRIVVDERERNSRIPKLLRDAGVRVDFAQLKVGDYITSSATAIERKTINDLIDSIYDGRLFLQCSDLNQYYSKPVLVIEGNILDLADIPVGIANDKQLKILLERLPLAYQTLTKIALNFRIPMVHTPSAEYTSQLLILMAKIAQQSEGDTGPLLRKIKKEKPIYFQQLSILTSIPGIGDKMAIKMLQKFKTPNRALNATIAELGRISGFGTARAIKVREILDRVVVRDLDITAQTTLWDDKS